MVVFSFGVGESQPHGLREGKRTGTFLTLSKGFGKGEGLNSSALLGSRLEPGGKLKAVGEVGGERSSSKDETKAILLFE